MPQPSRKPKGKPTVVRGHRRSKARYADLVCDIVEPEEGSEPLKVTVRTNLRFGDVDSIPLGADVTMEEAFKAIAPYVVAWNVIDDDIETGELIAVPPPAEAGPKVLSLLDMDEAIWLIIQTKYAFKRSQDDNRGKGLATPEPTESPPNGRASLVAP
jgi:hypothetical protein